jgi:predicted DNA-binding protein
MKKNLHFTFRLNDNEKKLLEILANFFQRSKSQTIRFMIKELAKHIEEMNKCEDHSN